MLYEMGMLIIFTIKGLGHNEYYFGKHYINFHWNDSIKMTGSTSVSQMTRAEIIIVVSIGRIIVEPVLSRKVVPSIFAAVIFASILLIIHFFELKSKKVEQFLNGSSFVIVENGEIIKANLMKAKCLNNNFICN